MRPYKIVVVDDPETTTTIIVAPFERAPEPGETIHLPHGERITVTHVIGARRDGFAGTVVAGPAGITPDGITRHLAGRLYRHEDQDSVESHRGDRRAHPDRRQAPAKAAATAAGADGNNRDGRAQAAARAAGALVIGD